MKTREYNHHRTVSRLISFDAVIMTGCVLAVLISGAATYYATFGRLFSFVIEALPH